MQMEIFMKDNGKMIKHMGMVFTLIKMEQNTTDNGSKISNMVMELKHGQMVLNMMDNI